jgi:hypothetical protein
VGGRVSTGWLKQNPVVRRVSVGGRLSTDWLNLYTIIR